MRLEPPRWWYGGKRAPVLLLPAAYAYDVATELRFRLTRPQVSPLPVFCVGNFTMGGAGKTPTAIALAHMLAEVGRKPAFLTRGYGGSESGPLPVKPDHGAEEVGDEALLLARHFPTVVSRKRPEGARLIEEMGCDCIVMDDGFQNPSLHKDFCLAVVDGGAGFGNGRVFPAGPLRGALRRQLPRANAILILGGSVPRRTALAARFAGLPVLRGDLRPAPAVSSLAGQRVIAYCGIGRPQKFFETMKETGAVLVKGVRFPDHHPFTEKEAARLLSLASRKRAALVTTEKDFARLAGKEGRLRELRDKSFAIPVALALDGNEGMRLEDLLRDAIRKAKSRSGQQPD